MTIKHLNKLLLETRFISIVIKLKVCIVSCSNGDGFRVRYFISKLLFNIQYGLINISIKRNKIK